MKFEKRLEFSLRNIDYTEHTLFAYCEQVGPTILATDHVMINSEDDRAEAPVLKAALISECV